MHEEAPWGTKGYKYIEEFLPYCKDLGCVTILDYGCGQMTVRDHLIEIDPTIFVSGYDPAIPEYAGAPYAANFVVCTDVMEHVEEEHVRATFEYICSLATKGAYFNIALTKAKRSLPDGQNAHITIKPWDWWADRAAGLPWILDKSDVGRKNLKLWLRKK
jgi:hypothetical protein